MGLCSLCLKVIVRNGDAPSKTIYKLRGVALRIPRDPSSDRMAIKLRVNLSTRRGNHPVLKNVSNESLGNSASFLLT